MTNNQPQILVSICCITYNHAPFIRKAFEGFLMQLPPSFVPQDAKMSDWCEILIHDDCSTDGTDNIIREYAAQYPDLIFPLFEEENQYSHGGAGKIDLYNYNRARGKYIAYCEGDDYWTDPNKLQKQVNFMEAHPEYSVCFHRYKDINKDGLPTKMNACDTLFAENDEGIDIGIKRYFENWYTQPTTMVFRTKCHQNRWHDLFTNYCDSCEIYLLLKHGKCRILNFDGANYRHHVGGVASGRARMQSMNIALSISGELLLYDPNPYTKKNWQNVILWVLDELSTKNDKQQYRKVLRQEFIRMKKYMIPISWIILKRHLIKRK